MSLQTQKQLQALIMTTTTQLVAIQAHNSSGLGWASPGTDYGARIAVIANQLRHTQGDSV